MLDILTPANVGRAVKSGKWMMQGGYLANADAPPGSDRVRFAGQIVAVAVAGTWMDFPARSGRSRGPRAPARSSRPATVRQGAAGHDTCFKVQAAMPAPTDASLTRSSAPAPRRRGAGFTLLETMIGLSIFVIAGLCVMEVLGLINQNSTANRALTAGRLLVEAKIAKAQTDTYTPSNSVVPVGCVAPTGNIAVADSADPFDFAGTNVTVVGSTDTKATISGTMYHYVSTFEAASHTLLITYTLNFIYRGKTYTVTQSTCRAPDQL